MNEESNRQPISRTEIIVNSDWATTVGASVALLGCGLLLVREINRFFWGHFVQPPHMHRDYFGIPTGAYLVITGILFFLLTAQLPHKLEKVACFLIGTNLIIGALLSFTHVSPSAFRVVAMTRSVLVQVSLAIVLVVVTKWLRSVIGRSSPPEPQGGNS